MEEAAGGGGARPGNAMRRKEASARAGRNGTNLRFGSNDEKKRKTSSRRRRSPESGFSADQPYQCQVALSGRALL